MILQKLLIGDRIRLTALVPTDAYAMVPWYQDTEFLRLLDAVPAIPQTEAQLHEWITSQLAEKNYYVFAIRTLPNDDILGWIALDGILWNHRVAGLAIGIGDAKNRGQGYGEEAMRLLLDFAFNELNLYRIQLTVFAYNLGAKALYEKLGFMHEGTFREFLERDGKRHDMLLYGLLRHEWQNT